MKIWSVEYFKQNYSDERAILIDCRKNDQLQKSALKDFWLGFADYDQRYLKSSKKPPIYKLKDWPTTDDICKKMPLHFKAFKEFLPCHEICQRDGALNLAKYLPKYFCIPDLGPKMYIAYGWLEEFIDKSKQEIFMKMKQGSTDCHIDISGAVNIMTNVVEPVNSFTERQRSDALRNLLVEGGLSDEEIKNFTESGRKPGALWHIWPVRDTEKIRKLLHKQDEEQYEKESGNDAIHDQDTYITSDIRKMLEKNGIRGKHILQCEGDAVFIPSGAIHQVLNINSCIKIACDFISPQCVRRSLITTEELRHLSFTHQNREDKLQLKAHLFHTAKEIFSSILWEPIFTQKLHQKPKHS